jgi:hypothetical protein
MRSYIVWTVLVLVGAVEAGAASPDPAARPSTRPAESASEGVFLTDVFTLGEGYRRNMSLDGVWEFRGGTRRDR